MDAEGQIKFRGQRLTLEQLLDLVERQAETTRRLEAEVARLRKRLAQYEPEIERESSRNGMGPSGTSGTHYSLEAEERRRQRKRRKKSPGRRPSKLKFSAAQRIEALYPSGVRRSDCQLVRERAVWRLEQGRAVLVGYRLFAVPDGRPPRIPGVTLRCEYGIEILVVLAFLTYVIGMSLDKACAVLTFFSGLPLRKSQADALLRQLGRHWQAEFDALCTLLTQAAVVYMDETGWKVGSQGSSVWTFDAVLHRVFLFGCHKDADTLEKMLPEDVFDGIAVSDDAATYRRRFSTAQKCWAHLLRKAIRLALLYPRSKRYRSFLDRLLAIYHDAKRSAADQRLGEQGRKKRVADMEGRLCLLVRPYWRDTTPEMKPHERDFANLVNELMQRTFDEELFTFVLHPEIEPTNNRVERLQRSTAQDRKAGRTSRTAAGAYRRSVIQSVLESLHVNLPEFTLASVLAEVHRWMIDGTSLFVRQLRVLQESLPVTPEPG